MIQPKPEDLQSPTPLKAWEDYSAACEAVFDFAGPWKDFAQNIGISTDVPAGEYFKPEDMLVSLWPALGISREYQEIARRLQELSARFQRLCAEFARQGADIGQSALMAFQKQTSGAPPPPSTRALYDTWIDCAEEAYSGAAHSEAFARQLADLCNILSGFKVERGKLLEALARHLDWPSRNEVDSLHRRVAALTAAVNKKAAPQQAARGRTFRKPQARKPTKRGGR